MVVACTLTEDIAVEALRSFFREKPFLFFGTGISCAMDTRFGMESLRDAILDGIRPKTLTDPQRAEWGAVSSALQKGIDLESALGGVSDQALLRIVTEITGSFMARTDNEFAHLIAQGCAEWPATRLLKRLVDTLPEGDPILHTLTPNYDMLLEYACDYEGIPYANGFWGGVERKTDWAVVDCSMRSQQRVLHGRKFRTLCKYRKHIRIYKVHGSLNYFFHRNAVIENNAWMWNPPAFAERVMITPGLSKYQMLQHYRQELLQSADKAIDKETHFLFVGYGFNDSHLEEYIRRKLVSQACNGLIVTRDSNPRIEALLDKADNLWLVCKSQESGSEDTRIFNRRYSNWLNLPGRRLWDVREFTNQILGG